VNKRHVIKKKIDDSIFHNLCFYINNKKVNKENKDKIIKILKENEKELKGDIKSVFEIANKTKILERKDSDIEKMISSMADIEEKIKDGFELNKNT
jgi:UDP-glucose 6-dehydrogenase